MTTKFRVLGAGVWGLAFSDYLLNLGHSVEIFRRDTSLEDKSIQQLGPNEPEHGRVDPESHVLQLGLREDPKSMIPDSFHEERLG